MTQATDSTRGCTAKRAATRTWPQLARHPPQKQEQKDGVSGMKEDVRDMVAAGKGSPKALRVQQQRKPDQRVPVPSPVRGKGPRNPLGVSPLRRKWLLVT